MNFLFAFTGQGAAWQKRNKTLFFYFLEWFDGGDPEAEAAGGTRLHQLCGGVEGPDVRGRKPEDRGLQKRTENSRMKDKEYIIFCDESDKKGEFYSNFYGGVLVGLSSYDVITKRLEEKKADLGFGKELKWQKVTDTYLDRYCAFMTAFFDELRDERLKVRVMFRQNTHGRRFETPEDKSLEYFKLYYQFIKHGFGLAHMEHLHPEVHLRLYFDQFPDTSERAEQFKGYLAGLEKMKHFEQARIHIREGDITEVKSHDHVLLQGLDVILGAMVFRLNNRHKAIPEGQQRRGKRTVAKEKLYKHILAEVKTVYPGFNIGISTGTENENSYWKDAYRHWRFVPKNHVYDGTKGKRAKK